MQRSIVMLVIIISLVMSSILPASAAETANPEIVQLSAGGRDLLGLAKDGTVWSWGEELATGKLGTGSTKSIKEPVRNPYLRNIIEISSSVDHYLALDRNGQVWAWGSNYYGQLGDGFYTKYGYTSTGKYSMLEDHDRTIPYKVDGLPTIKHIMTGVADSVALANDGTVWTWGGSQLNIIANDKTFPGDIDNETYKLKPRPVQGLKDIVSLYEGRGSYSLGYAIQTDGSVWGWGQSGYALLGPNVPARNGFQTTDNPVKLSFPGPVEAVQYHGFTSIAYMQDGKVMEWGKSFLESDPNTYMNPQVIDHSAPVQTSELQGFVTLHKILTPATTYSYLGLKADGTVWTIGDTSIGQSAPNGLASNEQWTQLKGIPKARAIVGSYLNYVLGEDGSVWIWGQFLYGKNSVTIAKPTRLPYFGKPNRTSIALNGIPLTGEAAALLKSGEVTANLALLKSQPKLSVRYGTKNESVTVVYGKNTVKLTPNSNIAYINGKRATVPTKVQIASKQWIVPLRWLVKNLGGKAVWDARQQTLKLTL
jgi:Alpha-tubulin suppressor and related RCC1 domain-containing proteins